MKIKSMQQGKKIYKRNKNNAEGIYEIKTEKFLKRYKKLKERTKLKAFNKRKK